MTIVALNLTEYQPGASRDWTPERRAQAAANVERFVLEVATDPRLPNVSTRTLRALYPLHATPSLAADFLIFATNRRWTSETVRAAVQAFLKAKFVRRCRGQDNRRCHLHNPIIPHDHTNTGRHPGPAVAV